VDVRSLFDRDTFRKEPEGDMNPPVFEMKISDLVRRLIDPKRIILGLYVR
jgi:hypothetical protein